MPFMFPNQKVDGILALVGGFALHLTLGTLYSFGNMSTYMTSYLRKHVDVRDCILKIIAYVSEAQHTFSFFVCVYRYCSFRELGRHGNYCSSTS